MNNGKIAGDLSTLLALRENLLKQADRDFLASSHVRRMHGIHHTGKHHGLPQWPVSLCTPDRKSTRLNSSHGYISYAVFCLKKKKNGRDPAYQGDVAVVPRGAHPTCLA